MAGQVKLVTDADFATEVLGNDVPVLVDFWAEWCGPCKRMAPMLDEIATENADRLRVAKLDIDANRETATAYGIMSIPTLMVFRGGAVVHTIVGARSKAELQKELADWTAVAPG
jgi:thioredoxin 1